MSNVLNEQKQQEVLVLGRLGWSLRRIEERTGVRRETVSAYLKAAGITVRGRGRRGQTNSSRSSKPAESSSAAKPAIEVTTDSGGKTPEDQQPSNPAGSASVCEPYREIIEDGLGRGRNAMGIWQDLVDKHGYSDGYQTVKRFVRKLRGPHSPQAVGIILTAPGEEAQVDYGTGPIVRDEQTGKYHLTRLFVLTLGYSRKSVRLLVFRSSSQTWAELTKKPFAG
jgi:transposase